MRRLTWKLRELLRSTLTRRTSLRRHRLPVQSAVSLESLEPRALLTGNASGEITGLAFIDANMNGSRQSSEVVVRGVPVRLTGTTGQGVSVDATTTTNAGGSYSFANVLPGNYQVTAGPALNVLGGAITVSSFSVAAEQTVTRDFALGGVQSDAISLRMFLTTTTLADFPFATAGTTQGLANERENNRPELANGPVDFELGKNEESRLFDLANVFTDPDMTDSLIRFNTSMGNIDVELFDTETPQTVANFFNYVDDDPRTDTDAGRYDGSIFHRLARDFVLQGGNRSFVVNNDIGSFVSIVKDAPIENEPGISNIRGTIAMAKIGGDPNSASSEFFFNINNNTGLDDNNGGFTVFGRIANAASLAVLDSINAVQDILPQLGLQDGIPRVNYTGSNFPADATNENFITINDVEILRRDEFLTYELISNSNESLLTASITRNRLALSHEPGTRGTADIVIRATDRYGAILDSTFTVVIDNTEPEATVSLAPLAPVPTDMLTATATKSDADGDAVSLTFVWTINGNEVQTTANTSALVDTLDLNNLDPARFTGPLVPGDIIRVAVTPNDGEVDGQVAIALTAINRAPSVESISFMPVAPTVTDTLTAVPVTSDPDGDSVTVTYVWTVNGGDPVDGAVSDQLDLSQIAGLARGDVITVVATPNDGKVSGAASDPVSVTVANSLPVLTASLSLTPESPSATDTLMAMLTQDVNGNIATDADDDPVMFVYRWLRDGVEIQVSPAPTASLTDTLAVSVSAGDEITVQVTPNDGIDDGIAVVASVTITGT